MSKVISTSETDQVQLRCPACRRIQHATFWSGTIKLGGHLSSYPHCSNDHQTPSIQCPLSGAVLEAHWNPAEPLLLAQFDCGCDFNKSYMTKKQLETPWHLCSWRVKPALIKHEIVKWEPMEMSSLSYDPLLMYETEGDV